ncbi:MAG: cyclic pyranopterin monophosphate synthase MoaC [Gemmatimonadaceae bacterium]
MRLGVARERHTRVEMPDQRELVLVRYPWRGQGNSGEACQLIEGFLRPKTTRPAAAKRRVTRYSKARMTRLTHVDEGGKAQMVDVTGKRVTSRSAKASGTIMMSSETLEAIRGNSIAKGDVLGIARVAGIMAAKKTAELIPLCHQIPLTNIQIDFELDRSLPGIRVVAEVSTEAQTGVEMEAITAVSVSLITLYDMAKGVDKAMVMGQISLLEKRGGKSGDWVRAGSRELAAE